MIIDQMSNESELIGRILKGNVKDFEEIISHYQRLVSAVAFRLLKNEYDREEICQEVFIKIYKNLSGFNFKSKLSTWIGKITYNHCLNYIQKQKKRLNKDLLDLQDDGLEFFYFNDNIFSGENTPEVQLEKKDNSTLIHDYINKLPPVFRIIITLFHIEELSYNEISEIMDLPEGTVKSYLFRARKLLKEKLLSSYKEEEFA
jgi:RNA polymerase sigma-70 factor (ECF subfamily)